VVNKSKSMIKLLQPSARSRAISLTLAAISSGVACRLLGGLGAMLDAVLVMQIGYVIWMSANIKGSTEIWPLKSSPCTHAV
jgi:hypothetical protein